jgi:hypothetical protein
MKDTKNIDCPEHPGTHEAILYCHPHLYAGTWECPDGLSDSCEHAERHIDSRQVDYWPTPDTDASYDVEVYVCDLCGIDIDIETDDPVFDRYEAEADRQTDEMRDN